MQKIRFRKQSILMHRNIYNLFKYLLFCIYSFYFLGTGSVLTVHDDTRHRVRPQCHVDKSRKNFLTFFLFFVQPTKSNNLLKVKCSFEKTVYNSNRIHYVKRQIAAMNYFFNLVFQFAFIPRTQYYP